MPLKKAAKKALTMALKEAPKKTIKKATKKSDSSKTQMKSKTKTTVPDISKAHYKQKSLKEVGNSSAVSSRTRSHDKKLHPKITKGQKRRRRELSPDGMLDPDARSFTPAVQASSSSTLQPSFDNKYPGSISLWHANALESIPYSHMQIESIVQAQHSQMFFGSLMQGPAQENATPHVFFQAKAPEAQPSTYIYSCT